MNAVPCKLCFVQQASPASFQDQNKLAQSHRAAGLPAPDPAVGGKGQLKQAEQLEQAEQAHLQWSEACKQSSALQLLPFDRRMHQAP